MTFENAQSWSLADIGVPKLELGNEKKFKSGMGNSMTMFLLLLVIIGGFGVDLTMTHKRYRMFDDIKGWEATKLWLGERTWIFVGVGALYLTFFLSDLVPYDGLGDRFTDVAHGIFAVPAGLSPYKGAMSLLLAILTGFALDLYLALKSYHVMDDITGWEALRSWLGQRGWYLVGAALLCLAFVGISFLGELPLFAALRQVSGSMVSRIIRMVARVGPYLSMLAVALLILGGFVADLYLAMKTYLVMDGFTRREAFRSWLGNRVWHLRGTTALSLCVVGMFLFTDLMHLPGLRYENQKYMASAGGYLREKKYPEALVQLRNAIQKNPDDQEARLLLARTFLLMKKYPEAEKEFQAITSADAASFDSRFGMAYLLLATGRKEPALVELQEAIRSQPAAVEPHLLMARVYQAGGDYNRALEECRLALAADHDHLRAREQIVTTALAGKNYPEALREAEVGRKMNLLDLKMWIYQALALRGLGRFSEAEQLLREASTLNPVAASPWFMLGTFMEQRKEFAMALHCYEEGLKREPKNLTAMNNVAALSVEHGGDLRRAHELAAYLSWKYPRNPDYADTLGWILVKEGKTAQAIPFLRLAVAGMPGSPEYRYHLGAALLKAGNQAAGRKELAGAFRLSGNFYDADKARALLRM